MKRFILVLSCLFMVGCNSTNKVDEVNANGEKAGNKSSIVAESSTFNESESETLKDDGEIDFDLSIMGADMVYATIYQMMIDPHTYEGKRFKIRGNYYSSYSKDKNEYYHFCMIKDAAACCAQGLELLWEDGKMNLHEGCPEEDAMVTIEGVFVTYEEGPNTYGRIANAKLVEE